MIDPRCYIWKLKMARAEFGMNEVPYGCRRNDHESVRRTGGTGSREDER
jgi:hypothetical protein